MRLKQLFEIPGRKRSRVVPLVAELSTTDMALKTPVTRELYLRPEVRKLNSEQARLMLVGLAWAGDVGARELLEILFPMPGERVEPENREPSDGDHKDGRAFARREGGGKIFGGSEPAASEQDCDQGQGDRRDGNRSVKM